MTPLDALNMERTALLVIDMQRDFLFGRQFSSNGWRIELSTLPWLAGLPI